MKGVSRCPKALSNSLVLALIISSCCATLISERHRIHNSVNEPDDPRFSLANLARIFYLQLDQTLDATPNLKTAVASLVTQPDADIMDVVGTVAPFTASPGAPAAIAGTPEAAPAQLSIGSIEDKLLNPYRLDQRCSVDSSSEFRRINATCNNIKNPYRGAAKTPLRRLSRARYEDGVNAPRSTFFRTKGDLPTARAVSVAVHETTSNISRQHSHLMMNFGQFTDHDLTLSPEAFGEGGVESPKEQCCTVAKSLWVDNLKECFALQIDAGDPSFTRTCIPFLRSSPVPALPGRRKIRFQMNDLTAYIDASQIYGSTNIRANSLRQFTDGLLKTSTGVGGEERLPMDSKNPANCFSGEEECRFAAGDVRNSEQAGLTSLHTLFLREHNRIAKILKGFNSAWDDEKLYQV
ncbi:hypothetical protein EB796_012541 [Bugula neritina]|uniref:PXDN n=1 Tax=Bugula neritina TaxID=10212 RepID=A0A7J7JU01_BUGNE|nr:hypothetical protein EB796_012541 [Bugula neritina]